MPAATVAFASPTRAQAVRWAHRRVAYRLWRATHSPQPAPPAPPAAPDRIRQLEHQLARVQSVTDQLRVTSRQHADTLRALASGIHQQVANASVATPIPPALTAALSRAQSLLSHRASLS